MITLTDTQLERQDFIDNGIWEMVQKLADTELPWDIQAISDIRELVYDIIHSHTGIDCNEFYPYMEEDDYREYTRGIE